MKRAIILIAISCMYVSLFAQAKKQNSKKAPVTRQVMISEKAPEKPAIENLNSVSSYAAYDAALTPGFRIADPTIRWYNSTYNMRHDNAVLGFTKLDNGIAHGRLIFRPSGSSTSGSMTGTGTVGTGTSLGSIGTNQAGMGVNGKNPYAGPGMYGSRVLSDRRDKETANASLSVKKD